MLSPISYSGVVLQLVTCHLYSGKKCVLMRVQGGQTPAEEQSRDLDLQLNSNHKDPFEFLFLIRGLVTGCGVLDWPPI